MNATKTAFQTVAEELASAFESDTRNDGKRFYKIRDGAPAWVQESEVMHAAHTALDGRFPDDWVYDIADSVASNVATSYQRDNADDAREDVWEMADGLVDVYNAARSAWLASSLNNAAIVDEACEEMGCTENDTFRRIGYGQFMAIERIAYAIIDAIETEANARDDD